MRFFKNVMFELRGSPLGLPLWFGVGLTLVSSVSLVLSGGLLAVAAVLVGATFVLVPALYAVSVVSAQRSAGVPVYRGN